MNMTTIKKIPTAEEIIQQFPLREEFHEQIAHDKRDIKNILAGRDSRLLLIVGPCSAWPYDAVLEYAERLKRLSDEVKNALKLVLRIYIQKPRTTKGWTGPVNQPSPTEPPDVEAGIRYARSLMVRAIELGLPIADEALFTHNAKGFIELLSWVAIGARSSEDQEHRIFASAVDCPVGMKNPTSGSIEIGVNGIVAAQHGHTAVFNGYQVATHGNEYAHLVLRGGLDGPNADTAHILESKAVLEAAKVKNPAVLVDASHDNCRVNGEKSVARQIEVVLEMMRARAEHPQVAEALKGFMIESFLKAGAQTVNPDRPEDIDMGGLSITDPCIGWEDTEALVREIAGLL